MEHGRRVGYTSELCKNSWTSQDAVWGQTRESWRNLVFYGGQGPPWEGTLLSFGVDICQLRLYKRGLLGVMQPLATITMATLYLLVYYLFVKWECNIYQHSTVLENLTEFCIKQNSWKCYRICIYTTYRFIASTVPLVYIVIQASGHLVCRSCTLAGTSTMAISCIRVTRVAITEAGKPHALATTVLSVSCHLLFSSHW